jgi:hypothetical protein
MRWWWKKAGLWSGRGAGKQGKRGGKQQNQTEQLMPVKLGLHGSNAEQNSQQRSEDCTGRNTHRTEARSKPEGQGNRGRFEQAESEDF